MADLDAKLIALDIDVIARDQQVTRAMATSLAPPCSLHAAY
jgi:hypothetical protein